MSTGPIKTLKGAIAAINPTFPVPIIIPFSYNPGALQRTLAPQYVGTVEGNRMDEVRFQGAPVQNISISIFLDATDALNNGDMVVQRYGAYPQLAQLEMLLYPTLPDVARVTALAVTGTVEIIPPSFSAPNVLFIWGAQRVVPVRLNGFSIVEEFFDSQLNTLRATVSLEMNVLTYSDMTPLSVEYPIFLAYQTTLQTIGTLNNIASNVKAIIGVTIPK